MRRSTTVGGREPQCMQPYTLLGTPFRWVCATAGDLALHIGSDKKIVNRFLVFGKQTYTREAAAIVFEIFRSITLQENTLTTRNKDNTQIYTWWTFTCANFTDNSDVVLNIVSEVGTSKCSSCINLSVVFIPCCPCIFLKSYGTKDLEDKKLLDHWTSKACNLVKPGSFSLKFSRKPSLVLLYWYSKISASKSAKNSPCDPYYVKKKKKKKPTTVNPEYFVCMLFSYISYARLPYENKMHANRYKASQSVHSGQQLYENFMRTKGRRAQDTKIECVRNILDLQYFPAESSHTWISWKSWPARVSRMNRLWRYWSK